MEDNKWTFSTVVLTIALFVFFGYIIVDTFSNISTVFFKKQDKQETSIENVSNSNIEENNETEKKKKFTTLDDFGSIPIERHEIQDEPSRDEILRKCGFDFEEAEYHVASLVDREQYHIMSIKKLGIKPSQECSQIYTVSLSNKRTGEKEIFNVTIIKTYDGYAYEYFEF